MWEFPRAHSIEKGKLNGSDQEFFVTMTNHYDASSFPDGTTDKVTILVLKVQ
jgi:hypothetical protein